MLCGLELMVFIPEIAKTGLYEVMCNITYPQYSLKIDGKNYYTQCMRIDYGTFALPNNTLLYINCPNGQLIYKEDMFPDIDAFEMDGIIAQNWIIERRNIYNDGINCYIDVSKTRFHVCSGSGWGWCLWSFNPNVIYSQFTLDLFRIFLGIITTGFICFFPHYVSEYRRGSPVDRIACG